MTRTLHRATADRPSDTGRPRPTAAPRRRSPWLRASIVLLVGALVFLFPFYYMLVGSLQTTPDTVGRRRLPAAGEPHLRQLHRRSTPRINLGAVAAQLRHLHRRRAAVHGGLRRAGRLRAGACCTSAAGARCSPLMLLVQVVPFQLLMIPLYVLIARDYGLADSYLGMILPFAINSTAVFIFRQYFLQLPTELFEAARIDGAGELRILWRVALPLVRPALLTAVLLTFIGPWNEFLWPFLITKQQSQAAARGLAGQLHHHRVRRPRRQPVRRDPGRRRACWPRPAVVLFIVVPAPLRLHRPRLRREGLIGMHTVRTAPCPYALTRLGVRDDARPGGDPHEAEGVLNPASGRDAGRPAVPAAAAGGRRQRLPGRPGRGRGRRRRAGRRASATASCSRPTRGWERGADHAGVEDPRVTWIPALGLHVMTYVAYGPLGPAAGAGRRRPTCATGAARARCTSTTSRTSTPTSTCSPTRTWCSSPSRCPAPTAAAPTRCCTGRCGTSAGPPGRGRRTCRPGVDRRPARHLDLLRAGRRACDSDIRALTRPARPPAGRAARVRLRGAEDRRRAAADPGPRGLAADPPRRHRRAGRRLRPAAATVQLRRRRDDPRPPTTRRRCSPAPPSRCSTPETAEERSGTVPNVVFPTAIEEIDGAALRLLRHGRLQDRRRAARHGGSAMITHRSRRSHRRRPDHRAPSSWPVRCRRSPPPRPC